MLRRFFKWVFVKELQDLQNQTQKVSLTLIQVANQEKRLRDLLKNIDLSVDVHEHQYSPSWAVLSLQGQKTDYIKFIDLEDSDLREIGLFLRRYERDANIKIDAVPQVRSLLKIN